MSRTPGPWTTTHDEYGDEYWFGGSSGPGEHQIKGPDDEFIAVTDGEQSDNACLIAAAPDLLSAARLASASIKNAKLGGNWWEPCVEDLDKAIAKAEAL